MVRTPPGVLPASPLGVALIWLYGSEVRWLTLLLTACGGATPGSLVLPPDTEPVPGVASCTEDGDDTLDPDLPLVLLVHGNRSTRYRFAAFAGALAEHDRQVLCYRWDQKGRLSTAASDLAGALEALDGRTPALTVLGHSLGGLIARRSLVEAELDHFVDLVTVATPFAGVASARTCSRGWARAFSFGAVAALCRRFTRGAMWRDFHPGASFILEPGTLGPRVQRHLHVITDERFTCRTRCASGRCAQDDFVFRTTEQETRYVGDPRLEEAPLAAGHGRVVGDRESVPSGLLELLRDYQILPEPSVHVARFLDDTPGTVQCR